jgi:hypothetical protein
LANEFDQAHDAERDDNAYNDASDEAGSVMVPHSNLSELRSRRSRSHAMLVYSSLRVIGGLSAAVDQAGPGWRKHLGPAPSQFWLSY